MSATPARPLTAIALALGMTAAPALAEEHPGALWHVELLEISGAEGGSALGSGLRRANETYFYGDHPVRMKAVVTAGQMNITIRDAQSGSILARVRGLDAGEDGAAVQEVALAWMDGLSCGARNCGGETTAFAEAPSATAPASTTEAIGTVQQAARSGSDRVAEYPVRLTRAEAATVPLPRPKPAPDLVRGIIARNPDPDWQGYNIARFARLGPGVDRDLSYGPNDTITLGDEQLLQRRIGRLTPDDTELRSESVLGKMVDDFLQIFTPDLKRAERDLTTAALTPRRPVPEAVREPERLARLGDPTAVVPAPASPDEDEVTALINPTPPAPRQGAPAPRRRPNTALAARAAERRAPNPEPFRPTARWRLAATEDDARTVGRQQSVEARPSTEIASLGDSFRITAVQPLARPVTEPLTVSLAPGLGDEDLPPPAAARPTVVLPRQTAPKPEGSGPLRVRIHPDVFASRDQTLLDRLFNAGPAAEGEAVAPPVDTPAAPPAQLVAALAQRGLALDAETYAVTTRVYWTGRSGSRGFWISLPRYISSGLVLIGNEAASVVSEVRNRPGPVRISDEVAEALDMRPGAWSDIQVIALKEVGGDSGPLATTE